MALVVVVAVFVALRTLGGYAAEASELEGVVVEKSQDTLVLLAAEGLREVKLPAGTPIADEAGDSLGIGAIDVGQVVLVKLKGKAQETVARAVQRRSAGIEAWCSSQVDRCPSLAAEVGKIEERCGDAAAACAQGLNQLRELQVRADQIAKLQQLHEACQARRPAACLELANSCRDRVDLCRRLLPGLVLPDRSLESPCRTDVDAVCRTPEPTPTATQTRQPQRTPAPPDVEPVRPSGQQPLEPARSPVVTAVVPTSTPVPARSPLREPATETDGRR
jgi:hypothetical protein